MTTSKKSFPKLIFWQWVQIVLAAALLIFWISSCTDSRIVSQASFDQITQAVLQSVNQELYPPMDGQSAKNYLALDESQANLWSLYRKNDAFDASEMLIAKFETPQQQENLKKAIEERIAQQINTYEGYAPAAASLMKDALVDIQGNYALYYVGENPDSVKEAFLKALKQKGDGQ